MKFFKKAFAVTIAAALSCICFAACGQNGGGEEETVYYTVQFDVNGDRKSVV